MTEIIFTFAGHPDLLVQRTYKKIRNLGEEKRYDLGLLPVVPGTVRGVPYSVALQAFLSYKDTIDFDRKHVQRSTKLRPEGKKGFGNRSRHGATSACVDGDGDSDRNGDTQYQHCQSGQSWQQQCQAAHIRSFDTASLGQQYQSAMAAMLTTMADMRHDLQQENLFLL